MIFFLKWFWIWFKLDWIYIGLDSGQKRKNICFEWDCQCSPTAIRQKLSDFVICLYFRLSLYRAGWEKILEQNVSSRNTLGLVLFDQIFMIGSDVCGERWTYKCIYMLIRPVILVHNGRAPLPKKNYKKKEKNMLIRPVILVHNGRAPLPKKIIRKKEIYVNKTRHPGTQRSCSSAKKKKKKKENNMLIRPVILVNNGCAPLPKKDKKEGQNMLIRPVILVHNGRAPLQKKENIC